MAPPADINTGRTDYVQTGARRRDFTAMLNVDVHGSWLPISDVRRPEMREETPASAFSFSFNQGRDTTPTIADLTQDMAPVPQPVQGGVPPGSNDVTVRLELLVRKAAAELTPEEDARLKVSTERLRKLLPGVTAADFDALADVAQRVKSVGDETAALRRELGLDD